VGVGVDVGVGDGAAVGTGTGPTKLKSSKYAMTTEGVSVYTFTTAFTRAERAVEGALALTVSN